MRKPTFMALALLLGSQVSAASPSDPAPTILVAVSNFEFAPSDIRLKSGARSVLVIRNLGRTTHNFTAPEFFRAAQIDPLSAATVNDGSVLVPALSTVAIVLTPAAGRYGLECTRALHSKLGMKGEILVE